MKKPSIAIIREQQISMFCHAPCLLRSCFEIVAICHLASLPDALTASEPLAAILDVSENSQWDELDVLESIRRVHQHLPVLVIPRRLSEERLIRFMRLGVSDVIAPPFTCEQISQRVAQIMARYYPTLPCHLPAERDGMEALIGQSPRIRDIKRYLQKVAPTDSTVLITGESGTGKELVARLIQENSSRRTRPFVSVNCAALPEHLIESELFGYEKGAFTGATAMQRGKFEQAHDGTIFLDEIGDMPLTAQAKILRVLENKEVYRVGGTRRIPIDARIIAATNQSLDDLITAKAFRRDLYYRLNIAHVDLPPLRDRKDDVPLLLTHYIHEMNLRFHRRVQRFTDEAFATLMAYHWPGNIRELRNIVEAAFIQLLGTEETFLDLPAIFQHRRQQTAELPEHERDRLLNILWEAHWNKSQAAKRLSWSRMTLYRKMRKYHIAEQPTTISLPD